MAPQIDDEDPGLPDDAGRLDELARLPHGRHGLPPEFVERNQRQRLIASITALLGEQGYGEATIAAVTAGAGVSSRTFYKYFETIEDCYLAAFDSAIDALRPTVLEAFNSAEDWPSGVAAALASILDEFTRDPHVARLLTAEPFVAGPRVAMRHRAVVEELVPYLRRGRELRGAADGLPESTERGLLGAALSLVGRRAFAREDEDFDQLFLDLLQFLLTPYLGSAEAHRRATA